MKRGVRWLALLATILGTCLQPATAHADSSPAGVWQRITVPIPDPSGQPRYYWLREPVGGWTGPRPTIVFLHGVSLAPRDTAEQDGLAVLADTKGAVLVAGEGWKLSWSAGGCCGPAAGDPTAPGVAGPRLIDPVPQTDDVAYLDAVWSSVARHAPVDPARRVVYGFSNGGMLAARWACAHGPAVPAVSVAGPLLVHCAHRVDLLHIHGRYDTGVPLRGGWSTFTHTLFPSSVTELQRLPAGSHYKLKVLDTTHRWAPEGHLYGVNSYIWRWVTQQWALG